MDSYPDYLSASERELRPALWTSRTAKATPSKATTDRNISKRSISGPLPSSPVPLTETRPETPRAPMVPTRPVFIPSAPRTEPNLPSFVDQRKRQQPAIPPAPKTEPYVPSFVNAPTPGRPQYMSPGHSLRRQPTTLGKTPVTPADSAIGSFGATTNVGWENASYTVQRSTPGTSSVNINCYAPPPTTHTCCCHCERHKKPSRMVRWKSALKRLFHRDAEEESDVEHIETSHWTDI